MIAISTFGVIMSLLSPSQPKPDVPPPIPERPVLMATKVEDEASRALEKIHRKIKFPSGRKW